MIAIVLAAGMGRRLGELTANNTKCMIEVAGKKIIDRILEELLTLDLERIIIVTGFGYENLKKHINNSFPEAKIEYVYNRLYSSTNNIYSLSLVKHALISDDTILLESDLVLEKGILEKLCNNSNLNLSVVAKYENWMDGTMIEIDENKNILNLIPKESFNIDNVSGYYKTVNIYKFSKEFSRNRYVPFLEAYIHAFGSNQYYEQVLNVLSLVDKTGLKCMVLTDEKWYEIDDIQDLQIAEVLFEQKHTLEKYQAWFGGYWRFPKLIDFCYLVNPYFPSLALKKEMAVFSEQLLISYPSGRKSNDMLASRLFDINIEYVCVGNGASELLKALFEILTIEKIGIIYPTFEEYPNNIELEKIEPYYSEESGFTYTSKDIIKFYSSKKITTLLLLNPDNPSGNYLDRSQLIALLQWAENNQIDLIIDESFSDFSKDSQESTLISDEIMKRFPHLIIIKSISKSYGVPGIRLGTLTTSNLKLINKLREKLPIWNINSFGEYFLQRVKKYENDYQIALQNFRYERDRMFIELESIVFIRVLPSNANYFLCELSGNITATKLSRLLLAHFNILIKDCTGKKGIKSKQIIRISIRDKFDNQKLISALLSLQKSLI